MSEELNVNRGSAAFGPLLASAVTAHKNGRLLRDGLRVPREEARGAVYDSLLEATRAAEGSFPYFRRCALTLLARRNRSGPRHRERAVCDAIEHPRLAQHRDIAVDRFDIAAEATCDYITLTNSETAIYCTNEYDELATHWR